MATDNRTAKDLFAQWRKIDEVKRQLVKAGKINGDATPEQVIAKLRETIPVETFPASTPK